MKSGEVREIADNIDSPYRQKVIGFLGQISPDMEEGKYEIDGKQIYARVMTYFTSSKEMCQIEAHNRYVDIQLSLVGSEGIEVFSRDRLKTLKPYQEAEDVEIFCDGEDPDAYVENTEGRYTLLLPQDAHRPQISTDGKGSMVKKMVIKVERELICGNVVCGKEC